MIYVYHDSKNHHNLKHIINNKRPYGELQLTLITNVVEMLLILVLHIHDCGKVDAHLQ